MLTPGADQGEPLHILSSLERRAATWDTDPEAARASLSAAVSLVLRLLGLDPDPAKSRPHVLLSVLAEVRLLAGQSAELSALMGEVLMPPMARIGALPMKTGRAYGIGVIVASQNPMDLDYRTLSNAGCWAVGRLQTDADRARVVDSIANTHEPGASSKELHDLLRKLGKRWFVVRNVHATPSTALVQPRWALSYPARPDDPR